MRYQSLITPEQYSRQKRTDIRSAMARALQTHLRELRIQTGSGLVGFGAVHDAWPDPEDTYQAPCTATVLPSGYDILSAGMAPALLDDTWEPRGQPGLALYKTGEVGANFDIGIRCPTDNERSLFVAAIEDAWITAGILMEGPGMRYGILLPMPDYWDVCMVASLRSVRLSDDEDHAIRNRREATITVFGTAPVVKLGPVQPLKITTTMIVNAT